LFDVVVVVVVVVVVGYILERKEKTKKHVQTCVKQYIVSWGIVKHRAMHHHYIYIEIWGGSGGSLHHLLPAYRNPIFAPPSSLLLPQ
jgi:hypothetical protein